jgi:hypothetical protein
VKKRSVVGRKRRESKPAGQLGAGQQPSTITHASSHGKGKMEMRKGNADASQQHDRIGLARSI